MNDLDKLESLVLELYILYNEKLSDRKSKSKFILDERKSIILKNFCKHIDKKTNGIIGEDFIKNFFEYSFGLKVGEKDIFGRKNIFIFNTIVSKKNFDRFLLHKKQYHVVKKRVNDKRKEFKIQTKENSKEILERKIDLVMNVDLFEEKERERFFNKEKGFINCNALTTLFHPKSIFCPKCTFSLECKENLRINLPIFFKIRING